MISPQQLVLRWVEYATAGAMLLLAARIACYRFRQPADRINLILLTLLATAVVPLLSSFVPLPSYHLGVFSSHDRRAEAVAMTVSQTSALRDVASEPVLNRQEVRVPPVEPTGMGVAIDLGVISPPPAALSKRLDLWWLAASGLLLSYSFVAVFLIFEWFVGVVQLRRIVVRGRPAGKAVNDVWMRLTEGRGGSVRVRISSEVTVPLAYGWLWPTVVVPDSLAAGDPASLRFCLLHEWTHIANGDLYAWRLTWACQFLLWFQPQFWTLRRELRVCQDLLADHRATGEGRDVVEYSELLMAFAQQQMKYSIAGTIALMDRSSQLSRRIKMLLNSTLTLRSRSPRAFCLTAGTLSVVCSLLIGAIRLDSVQADGEEQTVHSETAQPSGTSQASEQRSDSDIPANRETKVVRGQVVDEAGKSVGSARLWLPLRYRPRHVAQATTDDSGRFEFKFPTDWVSPQTTGSSWTIWAYAPGYSIATESPFDVVRGTSEKEVTIKLAPQATTRFKILTPVGAPLEGVLVQPQNYKTTVGYDAVPEEMFPAVSASTNSEGVATLSAIQPGPLFRIQLEHERFGKQAIRVDTDKTDAVRDIVLREPGRIEGKLTGERPEWLRQVRIGFATDNQPEWTTTQGEAQVVTDDDGRFTVPVIAGGGPLRTYLDLDRALPVRPLLDDNLYVIAGQTLTIEIPFVSAPKVYGKVQAKSNGNPVPNAEISLGYGGFRQSDNVVTDQNGRFEGRVLPGPVRVHIISMPTGHMQLGMPWAEPFEVPKGVEDFELPTVEVVGTHKVNGQLTDERDQPLAATQIMAVDGGRRYGATKTDADGRFTMNVPDGVETRIEVYVEGRGPEPTTVVRKDPLVLRYAADAREQAIETERHSKADVTLTGRVFSGGKPLVGVKLTLDRGVPTVTRVDRDGKSPSAQRMGLRIVKVTSSETDAEGSYRLVGLKAGDSYQIEVKPPFLGADPAWHHQLPWIPKLPENAQGEVALPDLNLLKLSQSLAGKVVDPDGKPVAGATVSAMLRDGSSIPRGSSGGPPPWTDTDREGRFTLQQLPAASLAIMAYIKSKAGGRIRFPAKVNVELNQQDIHIVLDPSLTEEDE